MFKKKYHCYIVQAEEHVKIGHTSNLDRRMDQLQTGNHLQFKLLASFRYRKADRAATKEWTLHKKFKRHHVRGEWFKARPVRRYLARRKFYRAALWLL